LKNVIYIILLLLLIALLIGVVVFAPEIFSENKTQSQNVTSIQTSNISSVIEKTYTLNEMISESDNVLSGTVIKADVYEEGVLYTITVSWKDVYKGRNYATMGYAYVKGLQKLELGKTYLFIGDTNDEKYHYKEPFEDAPWVFEVQEDFVVHASNGNAEIVTDLGEITLEKVKNICKNQVSSK